jgi:hypothetical protein
MVCDTILTNVDYCHVPFLDEWQGSFPFSAQRWYGLEQQMDLFWLVSSQFCLVFNLLITNVCYSTIKMQENWIMRPRRNCGQV